MIGEDKKQITREIKGTEREREDVITAGGRKEQEKLGELSHTHGFRTAWGHCDLSPP